MSLEPARWNLAAYRGATFSKVITYCTDEDGTQPKDLTGYTADLTVRNPTTEATLLQLTTEDDSIVLGGEDGTITLRVDASTIDEQVWRGGVYKLLITGPDAITDVLLYGSFSIKAI